MTDETAADRPGVRKNAADRQASGSGNPGEASFYDQLKMMWRALFDSPLRNVLLWLGFGIFALIVATAFGQVLLNRWNQPFYDALEKRNLPDFLQQLVVFAEIAGVLLVLNVAQGWMNRYLHIKLREGLVRDLFDEWMRAAPRASPREIRDRRESRPAPARGRLAPRRSLGRSRHRPPPGDRAACQLHRRAVGALRGLRVPCLGLQLRHPRLHGVGGTSLCRHRLVAELAARPAADQAERRPLCARGGNARGAGARQPEYRRDLAARAARPRRSASWSATSPPHCWRRGAS